MTCDDVTGPICLETSSAASASASAEKLFRLLGTCNDHEFEAARGKIDTLLKGVVFIWPLTLPSGYGTHLLTSALTRWS
jgi:hypothetical protein